MSQPRRLFTAQEDAQMLALRAVGLTYDQIGQQMMRGTSSIGYRIKKLAAAPPPVPLAAPTHPGQPGGRTCLQCGHLFASSHSLNRICKNCKRRHAKLGYAHDPL